jgi:hypothetical protein
VVLMNTGAQYINGRNSYLTLDVTNLSKDAGASGVKAWFGGYGGSACNLIERLTITSRDGAILERVDRAGILAAIKVQYMHDEAWRFKGPGSTMGCKTDLAAADWDDNETVRFIIPLSAISPIFASTSALWPAQVMSGMRFEFIFASGANALLGPNADDVMNYSIVNPRITTEGYVLSDLVMRSLNTMASGSGLELTTQTTHTTIDGRTSNTLNLEAGKSVSRALGYIFKERATDIERASNVSHFKSLDQSAIENYVTEWSARVGSQYFPQSSIRGVSPRLTSPELLGLTQRGVGKFYQDHFVSTGVSEEDFRTGSAVVIQTLERSTVVKLAGIPLSNSRILAINASWNTGNTKASQVELFLQYSQLLRCFSSNTVVEI